MFEQIIEEACQNNESKNAISKFKQKQLEDRLELQLEDETSLNGDLLESPNTREEGDYERKQKIQKSKERQAMMLKQFQAQQKAFQLSHSSESEENVGDDVSFGSVCDLNEPECCLCRDVESKEDPMTTVCYIGANSSLTLSQRFAIAYEKQQRSCKMHDSNNNNSDVKKEGKQECETDADETNNDNSTQLYQKQHEKLFG